MMLKLRKRMLSAICFFLELLGIGMIYIFILTLTDGSLERIRMFLTLLN
jgi:hypothetical protein